MDEQQILTAQNLAERFQINEQTVWEKVRTGQWPHVKLGPRTIRFTEAHVTAILTLHDRQPQAPRPSRRRRQAS